MSDVRFRILWGRIASCWPVSNRPACTEYQLRRGRLKIGQQDIILPHGSWIRHPSILLLTPSSPLSPLAVSLPSLYRRKRGKFCPALRQLAGPPPSAGLYSPKPASPASAVC